MKDLDDSGRGLMPSLRKSDLVVAIVLLLAMAILAAARYRHYLFFHTMAEIFAIVVSFSIFILAWISSRYLSNGYLIVVGGSYGAVGLVDIFHTLTFKGMSLFPGVSTNYPTQFWLTARFLEALALLAAPLAITSKPRFPRVSVAFTAIALLACTAVMYQWFPATFVDGQGLTAFKIYSEYIIIVMLLLGLLMLNRRKAQFESRIYFLLFGSVLLAVATEYCFTLYGNFYDFSNELGHYLRFLSVALAFIAIVLSGVHQPFELIFREMSQRRQELTELNRRLRESEAFHAGVFNSIVESVAVLDQRGIIIAVNKAWRRLAHKNGSPFLADNSVGLDYLAVCAGVDTQPGDAANQAAAGIRSVLDGSCPYFDLEYPCHSPDVQRWFHMHVSPLLGGQSGVVVAHEDVTERRTAQAIVHELAFHDPLTQLPNRRLLSDRLRQAMVASKRTGCYGAVMFLDLDNFKPLNDRYGHELGDLLLIEAAQRLRSSVRAMDTVARIGGDEFVVVLGALDPDRVESSAQALVVAEKIRSSLSTPYRLLLRQEGQDDRMVEHQCSVSIGVALFLDDETPHDRILKSADAAMYQAKDAGRNGIRFFNAPSAS